MIAVAHTEALLYAAIFACQTANRLACFSACEAQATSIESSGVLDVSDVVTAKDVPSQSKSEQLWI